VKKEQPLRWRLGAPRPAGGLHSRPGPRVVVGNYTAVTQGNPRHYREAGPLHRHERRPIWRIPEPPILFLLVGKRGNAGNGSESALQNADVAQLVEHHLAKVDVASSNLVVRSQDTVTAKVLWNQGLHGGLAERRGSGLQSRIHGFESRTHLGENHGFRIFRMQWAIGAAVARFPDTEEVTGSIPVSPTGKATCPQ
jgi:hypothetical protein